MVKLCASRAHKTAILYSVRDETRKAMTIRTHTVTREPLSGKNKGASSTTVLQASYAAFYESNLTDTKLLAISDQVNVALLCDSGQGERLKICGSNGNRATNNVDRMTQDTKKVGL
jgi:hypothetical protein